MARTVRVKLRIETMRLAGAWFLGQLDTHPHLRQRFRTDTLEFMSSLAIRSGGEIKIDRNFALRFNEGWRTIFRRMAPHLCLQIRPYPAPASSGEDAIAEIVCDIGAALRRPRGREPIDPLEAFDINERHKRTRCRSTAGAGGDEYAHELTGRDLGLSSKGAVSEAIRKGRKCVAEINQALCSLPPGATHLLTLTDPHAEPLQGVSVFLVPGCKQEAD